METDMEVDNDGHSVPATVDYRIHPYGAGPIVRWNWKNTSTRAVTMMHSQMIQYQNNDSWTVQGWLTIPAQGTTTGEFEVRDPPQPDQSNTDSNPFCRDRLYGVAVEIRAMVFAHAIGETRTTVTFKPKKGAHIVAWRAYDRTTSFDNMIFVSKTVKSEFQAVFWPMALFRIRTANHLARSVRNCVLKRIDARQIRVDQHPINRLMALKALPRVKCLEVGTKGYESQSPFIAKLFRKWAQTSDAAVTTKRVLKIPLANLNDHGSHYYYRDSAYRATVQLMVSHNLVADYFSAALQSVRQGMSEEEKWHLVLEKFDIAEVSKSLRKASFCWDRRVWIFKDNLSESVYEMDSDSYYDTEDDS